MPDTHMLSNEPRRATNVTLPEALVSQAKELKINISQACEAGLLAQVTNERRRRWLEENREAIAYWNEKTEREGLTLERFRSF